MDEQNDIYSGNAFNIARAGGDWTICRISDDAGSREQIILTQRAMDELRDYFAAYYAEDREVAAMREP